jgi:glycerol uptake facilitator-like aquaporin
MMNLNNLISTSDMAIYIIAQLAGAAMALSFYNASKKV